MKKYLLKAVLAFIVVFAMCSCEKDESTDGTGKSVNLTRDLALYINFDYGNCGDGSGNNFNGVPVGNVQYVTDTPNGKGKAVAIDGTDRQFINIPYTIINDSTNFSVSIWVKDFGTGVLVSSMDGHYPQAPSIIVNSDTSPRVYYYGGSREDFSFYLEPYQSDGWHMITVTATGKRRELSFYIDGAKIDTKTIGNCEPRGNKIQIGGNGDGYFNDWADPMLVDNFRVYRRCLSPKEVNELYKEEKK